MYIRTCIFVNETVRMCAAWCVKMTWLLSWSDSWGVPVYLYLSGWYCKLAGGGSNRDADIYVFVTWSLFCRPDDTGHGKCLYSLEKHGRSDKIVFNTLSSWIDHCNYTISLLHSFENL